MRRGLLARNSWTSTANWARHTARILGGLVSVALLVMLIGDAVVASRNEGYQLDAETVLFVLLPVAVVLIAYGLSFRTAREGGILMVVSFVLLATAPTLRGLYFGEGLFLSLDTWLFGLPLLAAGVLFLVSSMRRFRTRKR